MKRILFFLALTLIPLAHANSDPAAVAAAKASDEQAAILKLANEIQAQQAAMVENQAKIDVALTAVGEAIRVARIYSSRSGN